jgi:hypothetical protein
MMRIRYSRYSTLAEVRDYWRKTGDVDYKKIRKWSQCKGRRIVRLPHSYSYSYPYTVVNVCYSTVINVPVTQFLHCSLFILFIFNCRSKKPKTMFFHQHMNTRKQILYSWGENLIIIVYLHLSDR